MSSIVARLPSSPLPGRLVARVGAVPADAALAAGLGALLAAVALGAGGGLQLGPTTVVEIALQIAGGTLGAVALLLTPGRRAHGLPALAAVALLTALTALSIVWAVQPDDAWLETSRTLAYLATFAAGLALVRLAPGRWNAVIGATVVGALLVSLYALATKIFPGALNPDETFARLREPFDYWNAVGLMAALGAPGCLWLGARRNGHAAINALAYPVLCVLLITILLSYSRGALLAAVLGCGLWFAIVPLRLRGVAVLATSTVGAVLVASWVFAQEGLSTDRVELDLRTAAGHEFGLGLLAVCAVLLVVGLAIGFAFARRAPGALTRQRAGAAVLVALALVPVGLIVTLSLSEKGLGGSISDGWTSLTDPNASAPGNEPGRLTAVGSFRARYFRDALTIFEDRPLQGTGAGGFATARTRYRDDELDVRHAHGYLFQTASDLGVIGLLASLLATVAFGWAALRATGLLRRRGEAKPPLDAEQVGLRTLLAVVVVFGVHSFVDWTWFIPGTAVTALLCAGFLAGRGAPTAAPVALDVEPPRPLPWRAAMRDRPRTALAAGVVVLSLAAAWSTYQPLRAVNAGSSSLEALEDGRIDEARRSAARAAEIDPLSIEPLIDTAVIEATAGNPKLARVALERAVVLQPQNPRPWLQLAEFADVQNDPRGALRAVGAALFLDPKSFRAIALYLKASRALTPGAPAVPIAPPPPSPAATPVPPAG